jgi:hypothetical protein
MSRKPATPASKRCARDLTLRPLKDFADNPRSSDGKDSYCSACRKELETVWGSARSARSSKTRKRGGRSAVLA